MQASKELIEKIINELRNELKSKYSDFKGIYLFGSYARGDSHKYSDIDMAFVFDRKVDNKFEEEITSLVCHYDVKYQVLIDNHAICALDLIEPRTPFRYNVVNEGIFYDKR
jgi:predicted nucleotidyltransferase